MKLVTSDAATLMVKFRVTTVKGYSQADSLCHPLSMAILKPRLKKLPGQECSNVCAGEFLSLGVQPVYVKFFDPRNLILPGS